MCPTGNENQKDFDYWINLYLGQQQGSFQKKANQNDVVA
jgi:hypothetical protein